MELIEEQTNIFTVSNAWCEALEAAKTNSHQKLNKANMLSGDYEAVMPEFNTAGWKEYIRLTVKDNQITR